jgi:predicted transcriptional regulator of viral defense system
MNPKPTKVDTVLALAGRGPVRARDLAAAGIPRTYLRRLCDRGLLEQVDRGLYHLTDAPVTELHSLVEVSRRVPHATICLLSALQMYELTTEVPHAVWILIERHARTPKVGYPTLEVVRASGLALEQGVDEREVEGVPMRVTSPAKTVADCFRYRRRVGLDVAIAALRDYLARAHRGPPAGERRTGGATTVYSVNALLAAARADRVLALMRPYVEALA